MRKSGHFVKLGKQLQKQRNILNRYINIWVPLLGLDRWEVEALYHVDHPDDWHPQQVGQCKCDWRYRTATIGFSLAKLSHTVEQELEYIVVHELCHALLNETRDRKRFGDKMMEHEERVVTEIAYSFIRARCHR